MVLAAQKLQYILKLTPKLMNNPYNIPNEIYAMRGDILEDYVYLDMSLSQLVVKHKVKERYIRKLIELYEDKTAPVTLSFALPPAKSEYLPPNIITDNYENYMLKCKMQYLDTALFVNNNNIMQMANAEKFDRKHFYKTLRLYNDTFKK